LRQLIVQALDGARRGHIGPSMSLVEILRVLYDDFLLYRPSEPFWPDRDRLILSKGHGCLALYAILADKGFFSKELLSTFASSDSPLGGHPERGPVPGVEASTGALGHGLSIGVGMALAGRIRKRDYRVVVVTGDGELNEGSCWEAISCASKHRLSRLHVFVDRNRMQCYGSTREITALEPLGQKFEAFGFDVVEVDGHDLNALGKAVANLKDADRDRPIAILCDTVKGKGISFAEHDPTWHYRFILTDDDISAMYASISECR
jgi:transketolase